jgi:predicted small lipoprotein YifL
MNRGHVAYSGQFPSVRSVDGTKKGDERRAEMKRVFAALMLAAILAAWGCATGPYPPPADSTYDKFEREKATSSATPF